MKAMDILRRCRSAASDISRTQQRIAQRRDALTCIAAPQIRADGTDRSARSSDKTSELMADIDGLERALEQRRNQQQAEIVAALVLLDCLARNGQRHSIPLLYQARQCAIHRGGYGLYGWVHPQGEGRRRKQAGFLAGGAGRCGTSCVVHARDKSRMKEGVREDAPLLLCTELQERLVAFRSELLRS